MLEPLWRQVSAHVLSGGPCALRHGLCGVIVAQSGPSYSTPVMLGSGEGVSGRDTGLLSSFSGIGRRPAGIEEMVVYVDGKFCG